MPPDTLSLVRRHLHRLAESGVAAGYGPRDSRMWMASLDCRTGRYPEQDARPAHIPRRCYRYIESPRGCNLYWDLPQIAAAHAVAALAGDPALSEAADGYVADFLDHCVAPTHLLLWGNHYYYDAFRDEVLWFAGEKPPMARRPEIESGCHHEARPIPPPWDVLWRVSPDATERAIRAMLERHVFDPESGGFNRHADGRSGCAFLESGGILVQSAAWLFRRTGDETLLDRAAKIAGYSFGHRSEISGLLENNPTEKRWDKWTATTEVGLWAGCLLHAADALPELAVMAEAAVAAWLRYGFDERAGRFFGRLRTSDGQPILGPKTTEYQPDEYSDCWAPLFPAHDYPFQMAEACVALHRLTGKEIFAQGVRRWVAHLRASLPPRDGAGAYAEHYGRAVHFLCNAADHFRESGWRDLARAIAADAVSALWAGEMFRSHPGEDRYDAVDGVGYLILGLLRLETAARGQVLIF